MEGKELSKWKKIKRTTERIKGNNDVKSLINRYANISEYNNKIETLDKTINLLPKSDEENKKVPVEIGDEAYERLSDMSEKLNKPAEEVFETAIESYIDKHEKELNSIKNLKVGDKTYHFNITGNIAYDFIKQAFREKGRDLDEQDIEEMVKKMDEYLGDKTSDNVQFRFFKIPENDRLRNYQLLVKFARYFSHEDRSNDIEQHRELFLKWWGDAIEPTLEISHLFELEDDIVPIISETKSEKTELPFKYISMDVKIPIDDRVYYGIIIGDYINEENPNPEIKGISLTRTEQETLKQQGKIFKMIVSCYTFMEDGERKIFMEYFVLDENDNIKQGSLNKYNKKLINFIYSFCNFINEPEVRVIDREHNPKNNERRIERGAMPLPPNKLIRVDGQLRHYISNFNSGIRGGFSHKFIVRGHFIHFRDRKRYKNLYSLDKEKLNDLGYQIDSEELIKKWIKPFTKGEGIMVKKEYKIVKGGQYGRN